MTYLLAVWVGLVGFSASGCGGSGANRNPVIPPVDSTATSLVVGDSTNVSPVSSDSTIFPPAEGVPGTSVLRLAFISGPFGKHDISLWKTDGSAPTNLTQNPGQYSGIAWSPDGEKLAFYKGSSTRDGGIYVLDVEGGALASLTSKPGSYGELAWSPDGSRLAFTYQRNIHVMNADGSNMEVLTSGSETGSDGSPIWSPDGDRIAFSRSVTLDTISFQDVFTEIYEMKSDGTRLSMLTNEPLAGYASSLSWSSDGNQIAFTLYTGAGNGSDQDIYVMNVQEGNMVNLTATAGLNEMGAVWSPDGSQIAYAAYGSGIVVAEANGSGALYVSHEADLFPKWSIDGQKITYVHYDSDLGIHQFDLGGGTTVNLTELNPLPATDIIFFTGFFAWAPR